MSAEEVILIILSAVLLVLLILMIAVTVVIFKVIRKIQTVAETAEQTTKNFRAASKIVKNAATPKAVTTVLTAFYNNFIKTSKSKKGKK